MVVRHRQVRAAREGSAYEGARLTASRMGQSRESPALRKEVLPWLTSRWRCGVPDRRIGGMPPHLHPHGDARSRPVSVPPRPAVAGVRLAIQQAIGIGNDWVSTEESGQCRSLQRDLRDQVLLPGPIGQGPVGSSTRTGELPRLRGWHRASRANRRRSRFDSAAHIWIDSLSAFIGRVLATRSGRRTPNRRKALQRAPVPVSLVVAAWGKDREGPS